jgi:hypothetical protein
MISAKKNGENATLNNFKTTWKNFRCSDLPHFTVQALKIYTKILAASEN